MARPVVQEFPEFPVGLVSLVIQVNLSFLDTGMVYNKILVSLVALEHLENLKNLLVLVALDNLGILNLMPD